MKFLTENSSIWSFCLPFAIMDQASYSSDQANPQEGEAKVRCPTWRATLRDSNHGRLRGRGAIRITRNDTERFLPPHAAPTSAVSAMNRDHA